MLVAAQNRLWEQKVVEQIQNVCHAAKTSPALRLANAPISMGETGSGFCGKLGIPCTNLELGQKILKNA
jgi:hypothetical protein